MFALKKILSALLYPLAAAQIAIALGLWYSDRTRWGSRLAWVGLLFLLVASLPVPSNWLAESLEADYESTTLPTAVDAIVVLSGGRTIAPSRAASDQLNEASIKRVLTGVRLAKRYPKATLYLSGGDQGTIPTALLMRDLAVELGITPERIRLEEKSLDTDDQAKALAPLLADRSSVLVTSAYHLRRSLVLFARAGSHPTPCAADYLYDPTPSFGLRQWLPKVEALIQTTAILHEYLGLLWTWIVQHVLPGGG